MANEKQVGLNARKAAERAYLASHPGTQRPAPLRDGFETQRAISRDLTERRLDALQGALAMIPQMRSGDVLMSGGSKLALGMAMGSSKMSSTFSNLGSKTLSGLGALGGGLAISGIAEMATTLLPNFAAIPMSAFGGYVVGSSAFQSLGVTSTVGGMIGAGLGLGFGIYGLISGRNERRRQQRAEAEAVSEIVENVTGAISRYEKVAPLIDDEMNRLQKQYDTNMRIIDLNTAENARYNFRLTESINKESRKAMGNLNVKLAQSGFVNAGLGWFLSGEIEDKQVKALDDENWRFSAERYRLDLQRENLFGDYKAAQANLLYARYIVENELDFARRTLSKNLGKLQSNPMASYEQRARAEAGSALASSLGARISGGTKRLERAYYG